MITPTNILKRSLPIILWSLLLVLTSCARDAAMPSPDTAPDITQAASVTKLEHDEYQQALTALNNNDLAKAQQLFKQFIRNKPGLAGGYSNLALIYFKKNELEKSLNKVNKALELNPKQAQALNIRAQLYIKDGKIHKAKDDYIKAIKIKPDYINAQYNLALLYDIYLQEIELAITHYKIYLSLLKKTDVITKEWVSHLEGALNDG